MSLSEKLFAEAGYSTRKGVNRAKNWGGSHGANAVNQLKGVDEERARKIQARTGREERNDDERMARISDSLTSERARATLAQKVGEEAKRQSDETEGKRRADDAAEVNRRNDEDKAAMLKSREGTKEKKVPATIVDTKAALGWKNRAVVAAKKHWKKAAIAGAAVGAAGGGAAYIMHKKRINAEKAACMNKYPNNATARQNCLNDIA